VTSPGNGRCPAARVLACGIVPGYDPRKIWRSSLTKVGLHSQNWYDLMSWGVNADVTLLVGGKRRNGFVWEQFMLNEVSRGMMQAGFTEKSYGSSESSKERASHYFPREAAATG
jgi:hypothetical protein